MPILGESHLEILVFLLGDRRCALRLDEVYEIIAAVAYLPLPGAPAVVTGIVNVRGEIATLLDFRRRLGMPERPLRSSDHLILSRVSGRPVAIGVDRALEIVEVPPRDLEIARLATGARTVAGVAKLADGLLLIHSLADFLSQEEDAALAAALALSSEADTWPT